MLARLTLSILTVLVVLASADRTPAADKPTPDLKTLQGKVAKLLQKHYPKAEVKVTLDGDTIHFSHNTRKFMVHEPFLDGEWQEAREATGPKPGGIIGRLEIREGKYGGQAVVPQSFDQYYYTTYVLAPYSKNLDSHLYVHLICPRDVPKDFVKEFVLLVDDFERHVPVLGK